MRNFQKHFIKEYTLNFLRQYFIDHNFHEVETPTLLPQIPMEPNLYPMKTVWQERQKDFYLAISPESSLKKLIADGIGDCFAIAKTFRDLEDIGTTHNLEFSMLEWYEMDKNYQDIINRCQDLILSTYHQILKKQNKPISNIISYQGQDIDISSPWPQATLQQLFEKHAHMDLSKNLDAESIIKTAKEKGYNVDGVTTWEPLYTQIFINEIEANLPKNTPFVITNYPAIISPLCAPCKNNPIYSERFEFYIGGMEIGNGDTELVDSNQLKTNFERETKYRQDNNLTVHPYDEKLVEAVSKMPPCAGIGIGIDRIAMLFCDSNNIEDVIYFPTHSF
jgi:lysyl-tRNA synthetase, class II